MPQITAKSTSADVVPVQCSNAGVLCAGIINWDTIPYTYPVSISFSGSNTVAVCGHTDAISLSGSNTVAVCGHTDSISITGTNLSATIYGNGPSSVVMLSADSNGRLYTVLVDSTTVLSANMYAYNKTLTSWKQVKQDGITNALVVVEYEHNEVHAGSMFTADYFPGDINAAASANLFIETAAGTKLCHLIYEVVAENETTVSLIEGASYASSGTLVPIYNKYRDSATAPTAFLHHTPSTPNTGGTVIRVRKMGSGKVGGSTQPTLEFILKAGTKYCLQAVNNSTGAAWVIFHVQWYEHTNVT